jgi:hypothetical protein
MRQQRKLNHFPGQQTEGDIMEPTAQSIEIEHQFDAEFSIKVQSIRTATVGSLVDVIKQVGFIVAGQLNGQFFELPQTVELGDPDPALFKPLSSLAEADVIAWVDQNFSNMVAVKWHIETQLKRLVAEAALIKQPLPWASDAALPPNSNQSS